MVLHFLADFVAQNDWMAINKSQSFKALGLHSLVYSFCFLGFGLGFMLWMLLTHLIIDGITSRVTSYYWKQEKRHEFFVVIGFDQLLHNLVLILGVLKCL